ncbi:MAG TPA: twin-arginine translocase subunit TatC [Anaerolineales bacterium]|nr:twin-arginine translocase subunit TatC [Anaerolineales bacterium]
MRKVWAVVTFPVRVALWPFVMVGRWAATIFRKIRALLAEDSEDVPIGDTFAKAIGEPSLLLPHITALRQHVFRGVIAVGITTTIAFIYAERILDYLAAPVGGIAALQSVGVTENIGVFMRVSLLTGFAAALPYLALELLFFVSPGLKATERRTGCLAVPFVTLLFAAGVAFAQFVALKPALTFLTTFIFPTVVRPAEYYPFVTRLLFWTGIVFEIPIVIYFITALGLVRADAMLRSSRYVIVGLAVLASVITPTTDPVNMLIILIPLIVLYYFGVGLAFIAERRRDTRLARSAD